VIDSACGREVKYDKEFALPSGGGYLGEVVDSLRRAIELLVAKGSAEADVSRFRAIVPLIQHACVCAQMSKWLRDQGVDSVTANTIAAAVTSRGAELALAAQSNAASIASGTLEDFDWSLRVVLSSSSAARMIEPVVLLTLRTRDASGARSERVIELPSHALDSFLASFDEIDAVLAKYLPVSGDAGSI
jgi:hypothetical protein